MNALRFFRVAAPSIRIVPWAALASRWPLPQQLLPVSAAGGGRRRCSGKIILNFAFVALCGALQTLFSREGWERTLSVTPDGVPAPPKGELLAMTEKFLVAFDTLVTGLTACALSVTCGDSSPKGRAKSTAGSFLVSPNTLATNVMAWLSLRGKTSPAPGEDVTAGDKRGNLARERLRGRIFSTEKGCLPGGRQPFSEENKENTRPKGQSEYQNMLSSL